MASYFLAVCISLYLVSHPAETATVERRLGYDQGASFASNYSDGSYQLFPDAATVEVDQYQYFSENMDFDTIGNRLLLGAADKLYLLDLNLSVIENGVLDWPSATTRQSACENSNLVTNSIISGGYLCRNHIRLYQRVPYEPDLLFVCGTQSAQAPQCRALNVSNDVFGYATPPSDTTSNIVSSNPDYPTIGDFRRTTPDDTAYISWSYEAVGTTNQYYFNRQTITYGTTNQTFTNTRDFGILSRWIDTPATIIDIIPLSFDNSGGAMNYDFYFVFLRERHQFTLENTLDTEPLVLSRVLRICRDDPGVNFDENTPIFSTLYKARIYCNQESPGTGNNPLGAVDNRYNDLWAITMNGDGGRSHANGVYNMKMYGAFSTPLTGPTGMAICAYTVTPSAGPPTGTLNRGLYDSFLEDISAENGDGTFTERENNFPGCNGQGRPLNPGSGVGAKDILVSRTMLPIGVNPLIQFDDFYITKLVVDEACVVSSAVRSRCLNQDILFAGTNTGKIVKITFGIDNDNDVVPIVSEEITLADPRFVKDIDIKVVDGMKFIFATTHSRVYKVSVERCNRHRTRSACIEARDPYCAWNTVQLECQYFNITASGTEFAQVPTYLLQNVHLGFIVENMPSVGLEMEEYTVDEADETFALNIISNGPVPDGWVEFDLVGAAQEVLYTSSVTIPSTTNSTIMQVTIPKDDIFTGPVVFTLRLRNTVSGSAIFTIRQANLTVIDASGIYGQIGLKYTEGSCLDPSERNLMLLALNTAITDVTKGTTFFQSFQCNSTGASTFNVALYRFILTVSAATQTRVTTRQSAAATTTTRQLVSSLAMWVFDGQTIKAGGSSADVETSCNVNITTLDQSPCAFVADARGLRGDSTTATAAASLFGVLFGVAACICIFFFIVIIILVKRNKKPVEPDVHYVKEDSPTRDGTYENERANSPADHVYKTPEPPEEEDHVYTVPDEVKTNQPAQMSINSSSSESQSSLPPVDSINSAAPLMQNGVESKETPFAFNKFLPFARKDSPKVTQQDGPRMSLDNPRTGKRKSADSMIGSANTKEGCGTPIGVKTSTGTSTDAPPRRTGSAGKVLRYASPSRAGQSGAAATTTPSRVVSGSRFTENRNGDGSRVSASVEIDMKTTGEAINNRLSSM